MYLDGEWGTICANRFNSYAADAACQQLGYEYSLGEISKASDYTHSIPLASNSTPIHTGYSECGKTNEDGFSHILRCFSLDVDPTCTHDDDAIIQCSIFTLDLDGHDTELFLNSDALNSTYQSSGVLEIYSSISQGGAFWGWSNICGIKFDQNAANSACRQLGYTGALSYTTHANRSRDTDIWLNGVTCGDYAHSCLDSCFCYPWPQSFSAVQCDPGNVVALTCTFNLADKYKSFPGSRSMCEEENKTFCASDTPKESPNYLRFMIIIAVLSTIILLLSLVVMGFMVVMWNRRRQAQYQTIN